MSAEPVLTVTDLEVHYGLRRNRHRALNGLSLRVEPGTDLSGLRLALPPGSTVTTEEEN